MASSQQTVDHIVDLLAGAGEMRALPMFGEYGLYCDTKLVALICDDILFVKITKANADIGLEQAAPYPGAKPSHLVPPEMLEAPDALTDLVRITAGSLPKPRNVPKRLL
ncbi:TfoX/Sxy family protein [Pseudooceanicola sp.]|uniref:TfoX/Sxy family protein n=1 Tax=Pseudooceanicola sp. TaxID=1914328 RepID=UPI00261EF24C|nr:TfoX/Sxy family protein [Pseudooceanicola sp.]MDF1856626.1 TfoX/Sxy family protein [Pseudooceanicola sp.]